MAADVLAPGDTLGRYEIRRLLGRGGMGAVYEAVHRDLKKRVAIKVLSGDLARNEQAQQRFLREGEAASRIRHPNVVDVTDVGMDAGVSYLVMEYLEGEDLASRLARTGALPVDAAADLLLPVCAGVAVAHDEGVIHRDLKPENIFLTRSRIGGVEPKVLDFGVSKVSGREAMALTRTAATLGTPCYMPPEQVGGARQADARSDVYSLGVVLYECITGRRPFDSPNMFSMLHAIGTGTFPRPRTLRPELPGELEAVVLRAMRREPGDRFPSVKEFAAALLPFAGEKSRILWGGTFQQASAGQRAAAVTMEAPGATAAPSKRTTLGGATGQQLTTWPVARGRRVLLIGGVVAVAAVVTGGLLVLGPAFRNPEPPRPPIETAAPASVVPAAPAPAPAPVKEAEADAGQDAASPAPAAAAPPAAPPPPAAPLPAARVERRRYQKAVKPSAPSAPAPPAAAPAPAAPPPAPEPASKSNAPVVD